MGAGERCCSSPSCWSLSSLGARRVTDSSYTLPPSDSNRMRYSMKLTGAESNQFPHHEQMSDQYYFKSFFWGDLLNSKKKKKIWNTHILYPRGELHLLVMKPDLHLSDPSFLLLCKSWFQTQKGKFLFSGPLNLQLYLPNIRISPAFLCGQG